MEHSEYDSDYGEEKESDSDEDLDEEFEECDSSDEEALIDAFAPKTSWKSEKVEDAVSQYRRSLINNENLSPRSVSRNADEIHKALAKPSPITRAHAHIIDRNDFNYTQPVSDIITNGNWDVDQLQLPEYLVEHINSIDIGNQDLIDNPIWMPNSNGTFPTAFAWRHIRKKNELIDGSRMQMEEPAIGGIWGVHRGYIIMAFAQSVGMDTSNMAKPRPF
ncbi:hypothetical protein HAX54_014476 [Datura stramonium]|uniref:Uncharacterized protein n=1 Tax=Datura stramonium TaxID=4076 RepID=A0ABS8RL22_DATST|nr:hypothetical protein [Datura stramonium]